jgi:nucleotide-binding universal stress UspA family protein
MSFDRGLKTIVVATDLEGRSDAALEYARKLATNYGSRIVLAHGLDPMEYAAVDGLPGSVANRLTTEARKVLDTMVGELLRAGIHSHSEVRQGTVAEMLVDVARHYDAGLIVIGTKGMEGAGPVVVGAIAEQLVRLAPCPVMAVAGDWNAGTNRPAPGGPVLLAVERNEAAAEAAATAYSLAVTFQRPLLVLHVRTAAEIKAGKDPCATLPADFGLKLPPRPHHAQNGGSGWLLNEAPVHCIVKDGDPEVAIQEAIAECHPCILVAGVKRMSASHGPHGTAFALLTASRVPVLCVPPVALRVERVEVDELVALPVGAP